MAKAATLQLINVSQFHDSIFDPALQLSKSVKHKVAYDFALADMLDAIWWLQLGVELEYFPEEYANKLLGRSDAQVLASFAQRRSEHFSHALLQSAITMTERREVLQLESSWFFRSPETLRIPFQNFLLITSTLGTDRLGVEFISVCNFDTEEEWQRLITLSPKADRLYKALVGVKAVEDLSKQPSLDEDISLLEQRPVDVFAGFFRAIEFMVAIETAFQELDANGEVDEQDLLLIRRRIGSLQRWRFSMHLAHVKNRLDEISVMACRTTLKALGAPVSSEDEESCLARIRSLLVNWQMRGQGHAGLAQ